jgi:two-component system cell cycle sensor histidine kinase/response regulator CckA
LSQRPDDIVSDEMAQSFRSVLDRAPVVVFIKDQQGRYLYINRCFEELHRVSEQELRGKTDFDLFDKQGAEQFRAHDLRVLNGKQALEFEEQVPVGDEIRTMLSTKFPLFDDTGAAKAVCGIATDITIRKHLEDALKLKESRYKSAQRMGLVGNWEYNLQTHSFWGSDEAKRLYGFVADSLDLTTDQVESRIPERDRVHQALIDLIEKDTPYDQTFEIRPIKGPITRIIHSIAELEKDENGNPLKVVGVVRDVTREHEARKVQQELENQLLQAQKMEAIGTLAGGIAHDFNNMLGVILGNVSVALEHLRSDPELGKQLAAVESAALRARGLTQQLLTFARGGAPILAPCDLNQFIRQSSVFSTSGASSTCEFELDPGLWNVEADEGQLDQVVSNLVINATQAMPRGGKITISTTNLEIAADSPLPLEPGRYVCIGLKDEGPGIPPDHLPRIFDPYFTTKAAGTGLGLATAYSIVRRHRGHITVQSELQAGTLFQIYLPATTKEVAQAPPEPAEQHEGSGTILVLDDEEDILEMLGQMLARLGYETELVTNGDQAVEIFRTWNQAGRRFAAVLLDLTIPGGRGGEEVLSELLAIDPEVRAVVSSGYCNDAVMAGYREHGFKTVIPKPYSKKDLARVMHEIINAPG